ncbi:hypothetical protein AOQ71_21210 [Bradyrhizobium manausense]|uniref:Peptidase S74 domain-containing protein n=1 Tax=Bradyrhizobium manausense TaxID=989370 RepID=A0A0R3DQH2_9BRAD|nr:hypothetical protein AOQ71_21210 [Bradyrhizobium manausense]
MESDIAAMVAALGANSHYLILSILNGEFGSNEYSGGSGYNQIVSINSYLASTYPGHYLDIRSYLIQHGLSDAGIATSSQDLTDIGHDIPPTDLRYDSIHLNAAGYRIVAQQVANFVSGTLDTSNSSGVLTPSSLMSVFASPYALGTSVRSAGAFSAIGIGTSSPSTGLTITGGNVTFAQDNGILYLKQSNLNGAAGLQVSGNGNYVQTLGTGLVPNSDNVQSFGVGPTQQRYYAAFLGTGPSTIAGSLSIGTTTQSSPSNGLLVWGNVAVGTTSSSQKLYVAGGNVQIENGRQYLTKDASGNSMFVANTLGSDLYLGGNYVNNLYLGTGFTGESQALTILNGGNVGIGTINPAYTLDVAKSLSAGNVDAIRVINNTTQALGNAVSILLSDSNSTTDLGAKIQAVTENATGGNRQSGLAILTSYQGASTTPLERVRITGTGSVGVGTTSPTSKLEVVGNIQISNSGGGIYFRNSDTTGGNSLVLAGDGTTLQIGGSFVPYPDNTYTLGIASQRWAALNVGTGAATFGGSATVAGNFSVGTTTTSGNKIAITGGNVLFAQDNGTLLFRKSDSTGSAGLQTSGNGNYVQAMGSGFLPQTDNTLSLGFSATSQRWFSLYVGTGASSFAGTLAVGTSTSYSKLTVWGADTASSTLAFNVVNNASSTVFAVFDGGNAQLSGTLTQSSDARLKTNVDSLDASSSLSAINQLNPVSYDWLDPEKGGVRQYGFLAQQVQSIFPNLVSTTSPTALTPDGTLGLNYLGLISPIVKAIQALSSELSSLQATVAGFADSFTSKHISTQELCLSDQTGQTCITKSQLDVFLSGQPAVQISTPAPLTIGSTSTPPTIRLAGANPATLNVGDTYTDLGAIATDNLGHDLSYRIFLNGALISNIVIDTTHVATDTIDYVATDTWGNTSTSTRTVIILPQASLFTATSTTQ